MTPEQRASVVLDFLPASPAYSGSMKHPTGGPPRPRTVPGRFVTVALILIAIMLTGTVAVLLDRFAPSLVEPFSWVMFVVIAVFAGRWILFHHW